MKRKGFVTNFIGEHRNVTSRKPESLEFEFKHSNIQGITTLDSHIETP